MMRELGSVLGVDVNSNFLFYSLMINGCKVL